MTMLFSDYFDNDGTTLQLGGRWSIRARLSDMLSCIGYWKLFLYAQMLVYTMIIHVCSCICVAQALMEVIQDAFY